MSIHSIIDNLAVGTGALFMPKYYREGYESATIAEHLNNISMIFPDVQGEGDYEIGAAETPFEYCFNRIFPTSKLDILANLVLVRAPFHRKMKEFQHGRFYNQPAP